MKNYFRDCFRAGNVEAGEDKVVRVVDRVGLDVVISDAVMELVRAGIHEDAHLWETSWRELDDDDLAFALDTPKVMARAFELVKPQLIAKLREALEHRRAETARHPEVK